MHCLTLPSEFVFGLHILKTKIQKAVHTGKNWETSLHGIRDSHRTAACWRTLNTCPRCGEDSSFPPVLGRLLSPETIWIRRKNKQGVTKSPQNFSTQPLTSTYVFTWSFLKNPMPSSEYENLPRSKMQPKSGQAELSINQSINQPTNQPINRTERSINQSIKPMRSTYTQTRQSINQSNNRSVVVHVPISGARVQKTD